MPDRLLTWKEVATLLSVEIRTVRRLVANELLEAPRVYNGVGVRFREVDVVRYQAAHSVKWTPPKTSSRGKQTGQDGTGKDK